MSRIVKRDTIEGVAIYDDSQDPKVNYTMASKGEVNEEYLKHISTDRIEEALEALNVTYFPLPVVTDVRPLEVGDKIMIATNNLGDIELHL